MKIKNQSIIALTAGICLSIFFAGCNPARKPIPGPTPPGAATPGPATPGPTTPGPMQQIQPGQGMPGGTPIGQNPDGRLGGTQIGQQVPGPQISPDRQRAENLKNELSKVREIEHINVIVSGNTALVSYKPSAYSKDTNTTKNLVIDRVKAMDNNITNVAASESGDVAAKINQLGTDMMNNRPANEIADEINQLMQKIAPAVR